jgi:hypothetical protein
MLLRTEPGAETCVWYYRCLICALCDQRSEYLTDPPTRILVINCPC